MRNPVILTKAGGLCSPPAAASDEPRVAEVAALAARCWSQDPADRPGFAEIDEALAAMVGLRRHSSSGEAGGAAATAVTLT